MAAFDWYQATIRSSVDDVLESLVALAPGLKLSHERGMHGYAMKAVLGNDDEGKVANVMYGGTHEYPHATVSSDWAQPGAQLIRASFPGQHSVTRVDVREDFIDEGAFDAIQSELVEVAKAHRVQVGTAGDHLLTKEGRTVYLGSTKSAVRLRLYDKRAEVLAKLPAFGAERARAWAAMGAVVPDHWARLEAQIRPQTREAKAEFATIEPEQALGCSAWMREVWRAVCGLQLSPVQVARGYRVSDDQRSLAFMLRQYGPTLRRLREELGSWSCVGLQLGHELDQVEDSQ
jgi:hypothetical protein